MPEIWSSLVPILLADLLNPGLKRINVVLNKASAFLMPVILGLVALAPLADPVAYFRTG